MVSALVAVNGCTELIAGARGQVAQHTHRTTVSIICSNLFDDIYLNVTSLLDDSSQLRPLFKTSFVVDTKLSGCSRKNERCTKGG